MAAPKKSFPSWLFRPGRYIIHKEVVLYVGYMSLMTFQTISRTDIEELTTSNSKPKSLNLGIVDIFDKLVHNELQVLIQNFCLSHIKKRKKWRKKNSVRFVVNKVSSLFFFYGSVIVVALLKLVIASQLVRDAHCQVLTSQGPSPTMDRDSRALISPLNPCSNSFFSLEDVYDGNDAAAARSIKAAGGDAGSAAQGDLYSSGRTTWRRNNEVAIESGNEGGQDIMREVRITYLYGLTYKY